MTIRAWSRAGRRTIGAHGGVISPADGAGCHGVRADRLGPNLSAPTFLERTADNGRSSAAQRAAGSSGSGWNAVWEPSQILISLIREFWPDSLLERAGFEPSVPAESGFGFAREGANVRIQLSPAESHTNPIIPIDFDSLTSCTTRSSVAPETKLRSLLDPHPGDRARRRSIRG